VNDYAGAEDSGSGGGGGSSEGPKIIIENLYMRDGTVMVSAPAMTDETLSAPLPDIHLADIGKDGGGATPAEVASQVMAAIAASAKQAVQSVDVDALLKGAGEMAGEAQEELEKATEGAGGAASEALDDATEGLKKLLE
jgi:hypothetical protein